MHVIKIITGIAPKLWEKTPPCQWHKIHVYGMIRSMNNDMWQWMIPVGLSTWRLSVRLNVEGSERGLLYSCRGRGYQHNLFVDYCGTIPKVANWQMVTRCSNSFLCWNQDVSYDMRSACMGGTYISLWSRLVVLSYVHCSFRIFI